MVIKSENADNYKYLFLRIHVIIFLGILMFSPCGFYTIFEIRSSIRLHHNFSDPSKVSGSPAKIKSAFVNTRDEIKAYCESFVSEHL